MPRSARLLGCVAALCLACGDPPLLRECRPDAGIEPICGLRNPEDLVALPGGDWLLLSQLAELGSDPAPGHGGSLVALRLDAPAPQRLWPPEPGAGDAAAPRPGWGDPACPGPPDRTRFAPHGIDLVRRAGHPLRLLVVNHGGREAVEQFELELAHDAPVLHWRGCSVLPDAAHPNDVAGLPGREAPGGFVVTKMLSGMHGLALVTSGIRLTLGWTTGAALEWRPGAGWREIPGTAGTAPNGIAVSPDGSTLYVALWGERALLVADREAEPGGSAPRRIALTHRPDNLSWTPDGMLLVTGQRASQRAISSCRGVTQGTCAIAFAVTRVDPATLEARDILEHDGRTAMGMATSAIAHRGALWIGGSFGDRIARAPYAPAVP